MVNTAKKAMKKLLFNALHFSIRGRVKGKGIYIHLYPFTLTHFRGKITLLLPYFYPLPFF